MLQVADKFTDDGDGELFPASPASLPLVRHDPVSPAVPALRYGARSGVNIPAVILIVLLHMLLIFALMQARQHFQRFQERRLSVVNLSPPSPPPAAETPPPPPSRPEVAAPPPLVHVPVPPMPQVATIPDPAPVATPAAPLNIAAPVAVQSAPMAMPGTVQAGDIGAQMVAGKPPRYPVESRRKHEQGTVVLALTLGVDGAVETLAIMQSSGFARLDNAARDAVRNWRWRPVIRDGQAVRVKGVVEIPFVLQARAA